MKKRSPKKITFQNLEKFAFKYIERFSTSENQLRIILKKKIIKSSYFFKIKVEDHIDYIDLIIEKFKKIGLIDDKKYSESRALNLVKRGFSKKKILFNLKQKGISSETIEIALNNLKKFFFNYELASALIYAKKKKIIGSEMNLEKSFKNNQKKLMKMASAGFSYSISKKIIELNNEKEIESLEKYANEGIN